MIREYGHYQSKATFPIRVHPGFWMIFFVVGGALMSPHASRAANRVGESTLVRQRREVRVQILVRGHRSSCLSRLQQLPLARDIVGCELSDDAVCDLGKSIGRQGQDGWTCAREADAQQTWLRGRSHGLQNLSQTGDQSLAIWLVHLVLHCQIDHVWVGWGAPQGGRK